MCQYDEPERGLTILSSRLVATLPSCPCGPDRVHQGSPSTPNPEAPPFLPSAEGDPVARDNSLSPCPLHGSHREGLPALAGGEEKAIRKFSIMLQRSLGAAPKMRQWGWAEIRPLASVVSGHSLKSAKWKERWTDLVRQALFMENKGLPLESVKETISGKSKAGVLYEVGSKHTEPFAQSWCQFGDIYKLWAQNHWGLLGPPTTSLNES